MRKPRNIVGPPVEGDDFYGRDRDLLRLWNEAQAQSLVLTAPRRVGKTSLLRGFVHHVRANGGRAVYVDVQGAASELGFVERLVAALRAVPEGEVPRAVFRRMGNLIGRIESFKAGVEIKLRDAEVAVWRREGDELREILAAVAQARGAGWFILVDELPVLVKNLADLEEGARRADQFLSWCRELRQLQTSAVPVRWVFCGSIGLVALTNRLGLTKTINDLAEFRLGPFEDQTAREFLHALATTQQLAMDTALADAIVARTRWLIPHHLQIVFHELNARREARPPAERVADAFAEAVRKRHYFEPWYERLDEELSASDARHARAMLEVCAKDPDGVRFATLSGSIADELTDARSRQETVLRLVRALEEDGYVEASGDRWRFRSELLRSFWLWRYVP